MNLNDVKNAIIEQYPEFEGSKFVENTKGWSNYVLVVDDRYVFRMPRHDNSYVNLEIEKILLPYIKAKTEVKIPEFKYVSDLNSEYSFIGYDMIEGQELSRQLLNEMDAASYEQLARQIGGFLESLHSVDIKSPIFKALRISNQFQNLLQLEQKILDQASQLLSDDEMAWTANLFDAFHNELCTFNNSFSLLHSDFTEDHILVNDTYGLAGIIDFGDICIGDPAFDFAGIYSSYGKAFMERVLGYYHLHLDANFMRRIEEFYIKQVPLHKLLYGIENGNALCIEESIDEINEMMKK